MRFLSLLLPFTLLATPAFANDGKSLKDHLPSEAEVEKIISELPDFNHMMDGLMEIAQDENLREKFTDSAAHMKEQLEESGAMEMRGNGLPDFNAAIAVMLRTFTDKDGLGGMIDVLEDVSKELEGVMEESLKDVPREKTDKSRLNHTPNAEDVKITDI